MPDNKWGKSDFTEGPQERKPGEAPALMAEQPGRGGSNCSKHPDRSASWECEKCHKVCCDECAGTYQSCPWCGGVCIPLEKKAVQTAAAATKSFFMLLLDSFTYPLRGKGIILLIIGVVFFFMLFFVLGFHILRWIFLLIGGGFFCAFFMQIVASSANGENELPDWPDVTNIIEDLAIPFVKFIGTFIVSYLPLLIYMYYLYRNPFSFSKPVFKSLEVLGSIYFPMALIATALGFPHVFNPIAIFTSIGKVFLHYITALVFITFVFFMGESGIQFLIGHFKYFGIFLSALLLFYAVTVQMRVYGIIYYVNQKKLSWYGE